jgi:methionine aminotransferase
MDTPAHFDSKLPDVGVSIFAVMTRLADERGALNLSQGFPDFACDPALVDAVYRHMQAGENQYAPMPGVLALREALAAKIKRLYDAEYDPVTEITITSGATEAIFDIISALVRPGDEVILFEPCYDAYVPVVRLNGGTARFVTLRAPDYRCAVCSRRARGCWSSTRPTIRRGRSSRPTTCASWPRRSTARESWC